MTIEPEHLEELNAFPRNPVQKIIYAMGMLSDVVDTDMIGEERDIHILDAKEIICQALQEAPKAISDSIGFTGLMLI